MRANPPCISSTPSSEQSYERSRSTAKSGCHPKKQAALAALRAFNYERIYVRPASLAQSRAVIDVLRALVEYYGDHPDLMPDGRRRSQLSPMPPYAPL